MPRKVLIVAALSVLSIGSAYALTAAHTFYEPAPELSFANTAPTLHQSLPDTAFAQPRLNTSSAVPVLPLQENTPVIVDDTVDFPNPPVASLSTLEKSPRPVFRTSIPETTPGDDGWLGDTAVDSGVTQPQDSNRIATSQKPGTNRLLQENGPWTIGVFR